MWRNYLLSAKQEHKPISIYTNENDTTKFSFGFVCGISDNHILIASINPFGYSDGYLIKPYKNIYRIESSDKYGQKLYQLYLLHHQHHCPFHLTTDNLVFDLAYFAQENHKVVSIELLESEDDDIQGFISEIKDNIITVEQLDDYGKKDGISVISFNDITSISCDSDKEIALTLLAENQ